MDQIPVKGVGSELIPLPSTPLRIVTVAWSLGLRLAGDYECWIPKREWLQSGCFARILHEFGTRTHQYLCIKIFRNSYLPLLQVLFIFQQHGMTHRTWQIFSKKKLLQEFVSPIDRAPFKAYAYHFWKKLPANFFRNS